MRRRLIAILTAALLVAPAFSAAQKHGAGEGQQNLKISTMKASMSMMQSNMGLMAEITDKLQQLMSTEQMSPEQQNQILDMMIQMSRIMEEMSVPHGEQVKQRHQRELQDMRKKLDT